MTDGAKARTRRRLVAVSHARLVQKWPLLPGRAQNALAAIQSAISHHISETAGREMEAGGIPPMALDLLLNT